MTREFSDFDAIIIGQGLAGTALAWCLRWSQQRVLVIDKNPEITSSKIAAGLITPVTGQKLVPTWRYRDLWPAAFTFYGRVARETGAQFFRPAGMIRLLDSENEISIFERKRASEGFQEFLASTVPLVDQEWFLDEYGAFEMRGAGQLDVPLYLMSSRTYFQNDGGYLEANLDVSREIEIRGNGVEIPRLGVRSRRLLFCQGFETITNPWFRDVEFKPAKGEILTLRIPDLRESRVVHRGVWLAPVGGEIFKTGATYDWKQLDSQPTSQGLNEILSRLRQWLRLPFHVVGHQAAVRPIHRNQYPVFGLHPVHPQLGFFNGLGSKGSLHAPYFASQFSNAFLHGGMIDQEVDLNRKTRWESFKSFVSAESSKTKSIGFHVERSNRRSLTQQAQEAIRESLKPGDITIDATVGNGHDTQFLSETVGMNGFVYAFDIQPLAIEKTRKRISEAKLDNVIFLNRDHSELINSIPAESFGKVAAVMFNLGYMPGGDKGITTQVTSTVQAIEGAASALKRLGLLSILAYTGHDGGVEETNAVRCLLNKLTSRGFELTTIEGNPGQRSSPILFLVKRMK